jgi:hypothetical protein
MGQGLPNLGTISRHNNQRSHSPARLATEGAAFDCHARILRTGGCLTDKRGGHYAHLFSECNRTTCRKRDFLCGQVRILPEFPVNYLWTSPVGGRAAQCPSRFGRPKAAWQIQPWWCKIPPVALVLAAGTVSTGPLTDRGAGCGAPGHPVQDLRAEGEST